MAVSNVRSKENSVSSALILERPFVLSHIPEQESCQISVQGLLRVYLLTDIVDQIGQGHFSRGRGQNSSVVGVTLGLHRNTL